MTSGMMLEEVTSLRSLKDITNTCNLETFNFFFFFFFFFLGGVGFLQCIGKKLEAADDFRCVFIVYWRSVKQR